MIAVNPYCVRTLISRGLRPKHFLTFTCAKSSKSQQLKPTTASPIAFTSSPSITVSLTPDGIYKRAGQLLDATHTMDGKPMFPGKHKKCKLEQGAVVRAGNTLCCQRQLLYHPGLYVGLGRDLTLYSFEDGVVYITWEKVKFNWNHWVVREYYKDEKDMNVYRPYYHVIPHAQSNEFNLVSQI